MLPSNLSRRLHRADASLQDKLGAAEELAGWLLHNSAAGTPQQPSSMPPGVVVKSHYVRTLLDWALGAATKGSGGKGGGKGRPPADNHSANLWRILVLVLRSDAVPASQPLPTSLLAAATALMGGTSQGTRTEGPVGADAQALLHQLAQLLDLLSTKFAASYKPGLDSVVTAVEAALSGLAAAPAAPAAAWPALAAAALRLLLGAAHQHPAPRKVWDAVVPRLAGQLIAAAFPAADAAVAGSGGGSEVAVSCRQVLDGVIFHESHVTALAEACVARPDDGGTSHQTYVAQLLQQLRQQVDAAADSPVAALPSLSCLAWLVEGYCLALAAHRKAAEVTAAITHQSSTHPQYQSAQRDSSGDAPLGGVGRSADFDCYTCLARLPLAALKRVMAQAAPPPGVMHNLLGALAALTATLKQHHIYRPIEDPHGLHRQQLAEVADTAVEAAALCQRLPAPSEGSTTAAGVGAALAVLRAVLAVEHRVVQPHLPALWPIMWSCANISTGGTSSAADLPMNVASALVEAYSELRQLDVLLSSLVEALQAASTAGAAGAVGVVGSGQFLGALRAALYQLPSGQVTGMVQLVVTWVPQLVEVTPSVLLLADMGVACLAGLRVDLATAAAVAAAAEGLVLALAAPLHTQLTAAAAAAGGTSQLQAPTALAALLAVYNHALVLHARCSAMHPQVVPLPGQMVRPSGDSSASTPSGGYFAALVPGQAPELLPLARSCAARQEASEAALTWAVYQAAAQRLSTLNLRHAYTMHRCGGISASEGAEDTHPDRVELQELSAILANAISTVAAALDHPSSTAASTVLSTLTQQQLQAALAALVAAHLEDVQRWAPDAQVQALVQATLGSGLVCQPSQLLELARLRAALPSAVCVRLHHQLREVAVEDASNAAVIKKRRKSHGSSKSAPSVNSLLSHLHRLGNGKSLKLSAWHADLAADCSTMSALAAEVGAKSGAHGKKRSSQEAHAQPEASLVEAKSLLHTLARLELGYLQGDAARCMIAAGMAAAVSCLTIALQQVPVHQTALDTAAAALGMVARVVTGAHAALLLDTDVPAFVLAVCAAASVALAADAASVDAIFHSSGRLAHAFCRGALLLPEGSTASSVVAAALRQVPQQHGDQQHAPALGHAILLEACLAACSSASDSLWTGNSDSVDGDGDVNSSLVVSIAATAEGALPCLGTAKISDHRLLGSLFASKAHLLLLYCSNSAAGNAAAAGLSSSSVVGGMVGDLHAISAALVQPGRDLPGAVKLQLVTYLHAVCRMTHHMEPAASSAHVSTLLALLLHLLRAAPPAPANLDPVRRHLPATAIFPSASGSETNLRAALLAAMLTLLQGSSNQQMSHVVRLVEQALGSPAGAAAGTYALPLAELALATLECGCGSRALRTLTQHSDRLCHVLTCFAIGLSCPVGVSGSTSSAGSATFSQLYHMVESAAGAPNLFDSSDAKPSKQEQQDAGSQPNWTAAVPSASNEEEGLWQAAAVCTALRALESLAAQPRQFALSPRHACHMIQAVTAVMGQQRGQGIPGGELGGRSDAGSGAVTACSPAVFGAGCHLLTAIIRHRQPDMGRCLPLLVQAGGALLCTLVGWEVAAQLSQAEGEPGSAVDVAARVHCAEMLAHVLQEVAVIKGASKYCPHMLADYIILVAAPLGDKASAMLRVLGQGRSHTRADHISLAGGVLSAATDAALRQGAYALYGACSAAEIQYVYALLGASGSGKAAAASWRTALAGLKADHDKHYKYSGKV